MSLKLTGFLRNIFLLVIVSVNLFFGTIVYAEESLTAPAGMDDTQKYVGMVQTKIRSQWKAKKNKDARVVVLVIKIEPNGVLKGVKVTQSSGDAEIDSLALKAVADAAPFPPILTPPFDKKGILMAMRFERLVYAKHDAAQQSTRKANAAANNCIEHGDWQAAINLLQDALAKDPGNENLKKRLIGIYMTQVMILLQGDPHSPAALELIKKGLVLSPDNPELKKALEKVAPAPVAQPAPLSTAEPF